MTEEKQQKFTAKVRRGLVWIHTVASAELAKKKAEATGVRIEGFTASELADVESALTWIAQYRALSPPPKIRPDERSGSAR
jgi:hypothetical protein